MAIITTIWAITSYFILFQRMSERQRIIAAIAIIILMAALITDIWFFMLDQSLKK